MKRYVSSEEKHNLQLRLPVRLYEKGMHFVNKRRWSLQRVLIEALDEGFKAWEEQEEADARIGFEDEFS